jgi:hypothetical protein
MDMATTTHKEPTMILNHGTRTYTIEDVNVENDFARFFVIRGKRGAEGTMLVYNPETFGTCARVFGISELERLSDYDMTALVANQTDLITL